MPIQHPRLSASPSVSVFSFSYHYYSLFNYIFVLPSDIPQLFAGYIRVGCICRRLPTTYVWAAACGSTPTCWWLFILLPDYTVRLLLYIPLPATTRLLPATYYLVPRLATVHRHTPVWMVGRGWPLYRHSVRLFGFRDAMPTYTTVAD